MKFPRIKRVTEFIEKIDSENYSLVPATVTRVEPVGSGDRVCGHMFNDERWGGYVNRILFKGTFPGSQRIT